MERILGTLSKAHIFTIFSLLCLQSKKWNTVLITSDLIILKVWLILNIFWNHILHLLFFHSSKHFFLYNGVSDYRLNICVLYRISQLITIKSHWLCFKIKIMKDQKCFQGTVLLGHTFYAICFNLGPYFTVFWQNLINMLCYMYFGRTRRMTFGQGHLIIVIWYFSRIYAFISYCYFEVFSVWICSDIFSS